MRRAKWKRTYVWPIGAIIFPLAGILGWRDDFWEEDYWIVIFNSEKEFIYSEHLGRDSHPQESLDFYRNSLGQMDASAIDENFRRKHFPDIPDYEYLNMFVADYCFVPF